jgi:hypothetical protein
MKKQVSFLALLIALLLNVCVSYDAFACKGGGTPPPPPPAFGSPYTATISITHAYVSGLCEPRPYEYDAFTSYIISVANGSSYFNEQIYTMGDDSGNFTVTLPAGMPPQETIIRVKTYISCKPGCGFSSCSFPDYKASGNWSGAAQNINASPYGTTPVNIFVKNTLAACCN